MIRRLLYITWSKFLTAFGNIKYFKWPLFFLYDPEDYQISGSDVLDIMDILKPGDILLRGYNHYLDGVFIPNFDNDKIGLGFSHGAIYVGDNAVVHAVAEGVSRINVVDFMQCDRIAIFRPKSGSKTAIKIANKFADENVPYDFAFQLDASAVYCFELVKECYPKLDIKPIAMSKFFGLIKKTAYVAQSFIESKDLKLMFCKNKRSDIDFRRV